MNGYQADATRSNADVDSPSAERKEQAQAMNESLLLKWGTLKGWNLESDKSMAALKKYAEFGMSWSVATHHDSDEQKAALCELIDAIDGEIQSDWTGEYMTKEEAKKYVMDYGKEAK